jgi:hypothetical protein
MDMDDVGAQHLRRSKLLTPKVTWLPQTHPVWVTIRAFRSRLQPMCPSYRVQLFSDHTTMSTPLVGVVLANI